MGIKVNPLSATMAAEILGVDLSKPLDDATFAEIERAFHDHQVIAIRGQKILPQDQVAFTQRFGETATLRSESELQALKGQAERQ